MNIKVDNSGNYPQISGAGLLDEIVNKRYGDIWVRSNWPQFPTVDQMLIDILVEDYNERHSAKLAPTKDLPLEENKNGN